jgi:HEAT repeat protein
MAPEKTPLEQLLADLADPARPLPLVRLSLLSGLHRHDLDAFKTSFARLDPGRQRELATALVVLARESADLDFNTLYRSLLDCPDELVKIQAMAGLEECEEGSLAPPLARLLEQDRAEGVRLAAAVALGRLALLVATGKLLPRYEALITASLLRATDRADETDEVKGAALEALAFSGQERVSELIEKAYAGGNPALKTASVLAMGHTVDEEWLPVIKKELRNEDPALRRAAAHAIGELGLEETALTLAPLTRDRTPAVQLEAVRALGEIGGADARKVLETVVAQTRDPRLRDAATEALALVKFWEDPLAGRGA